MICPKTETECPFADCEDGAYCKHRDISNTLSLNPRYCMGTDPIEHNSITDNKIDNREILPPEHSC